MTFLRWALFCALGVGCGSTHTSVRLDDGTRMGGDLTVGDEGEPLQLVTWDDKSFSIAPERVENLRPPGSGALIAGAAFTALGAIGFGTTLVLTFPVMSPVSDPADPHDEYDYDGCEWCVIGIAAAVPPLGVGMLLLAIGANQRRGTVRELDGIDPRWSARGKLSFGIVAVTLATIFGGAGAGLLAHEQLGYRRSGRGLLIGFAPIGLLGVGYLWRGARVLRNHRPRSVSFGPEGLRFDLSL